MLHHFHPPAPPPHYPTHTTPRSRTQTLPEEALLYSIFLFKKCKQTKRPKKKSKKKERKKKKLSESNPYLQIAYETVRSCLITAQQRPKSRCECQVSGTPPHAKHSEVTGNEARDGHKPPSFLCRPLDLLLDVGLNDRLP